MSKEFNKLANSVSKENITIIKPTTIQEQLEGKLPLLSVETNNKNKDNDNEDINNNNNETTLSETGGTNKNNDSSIKKISFN
jgi:hypothetical protein